jgi:hypothetical protein
MESTKSFSIKVDQRFSDWDDIKSYRGMHNNDTGPGQYNLPELVTSKNKALSSMRNSPRLTIGLPMSNKRPYFKENSTDFMGSSSPASNKYNPNYEKVKVKDPNFSLSK